MSDDFSLSPVKFNIELSKKKTINEVRVISDEFKICTPKLVQKQKYVFGEESMIVHYKEDGKFAILKL